MSKRGIKSAAMDSVGTAFGITVGAIGIGLFLAGLPMLARVPFVGNMVTSAVSFFRPGAVGDGFGGV